VHEKVKPENKITWNPRAIKEEENIKMARK